MKRGWEVRKLGDICTIRPPKKEAKGKLEENDLVTFLPMEDLGIKTKNIIPKKEKFLKNVSGSYTYFANNDLLLAKITPCFENGKVGIARNLTNGIGFGSTEYIVFRSKGEVIEDYLFYFLSRDQFREDGKKRMTGAVGHKRVSKDFINNYLTPYPKSLKTQKQIVEILDKVFDKIDEGIKIAKQNLKNAKELFESYLQEIFENKGDDWEVRKLGELFDIKSSKRVHKSDWKSEGVPFYRAREVVKLANYGFVENDLFISNNLYEKYTQEKDVQKKVIF